jgi:hypothetical protein
VKRIACALLLQGCLCVGDPLYPTERDAGPALTRIEPDLNLYFDGGVEVVVDPSRTILVHFDETLDVNSLTPGISVLLQGMEVPIAVTGPAHTLSQQDPMFNPATIDPETSPYDYVVRVSSANGSFPAGENLLLLRTLILSDFGVPFDPNGTGSGFAVPFQVQ